MEVVYKTLVYNPQVKVEIISDGRVYDVSKDVVRGQVNRVVNAASQTSISLANKDLRYNNLFKRMDRIQISFKRVRWVKVFTGYLDSVPVLQLYPGTVTLRASCTIKRLLHTWWDPNLESSQKLMDQRATDEEVADAIGLITSDEPSANPDSPSMALTPDAGLGEMLRRILVNVGNWSDEDIHIQDVPTGFLDYLSENLEDYQDSTQTEAFKELFGYNETIGSASSGGGLSNATFTTIGPPANGSAYTMDELVAIVHGAGWRGDDVAIGASIIMAESTGKPDAINPNNPNGTIDRGLWQINSIHEHRLKGGSWFDPADSTRMAREIYEDAGNSWTPWSTYSHWGTSGNHLNEARASIAKGIGPVPGNPKGSKSEVPGNNRPDSMSKAPSQGEKSGGKSDSKGETKLPDSNTAANPSPPPREGMVGHEYVKMLGGEAPNTSQMSVNDSIAAVALYKFPMMTYTSGERYTDDGYHSKLQAADISNGGDAGTPEMKQLAQWWYDNFFGKGLLQLIHSPFNNNVGDDTNVGDGMSQYYNPGTMAEHRNHVHIAMNGVVSADGTTSGVSVGAGGSNITFENKLGKSLFDYIFDPTNLDQSGISNFFVGERAPVNDEPLIKVIKSVSDASLRSFQSTPDGGLALFYPDYFGLDGTEAVLKLEDIELKEFHIDANDDAFTTHVFVQGNQTFARAWSGSGEYGWLNTAGVATVENEWLFKRLIDAAVVAPEFDSLEEIHARYGVRPLSEAGRSGIMTPQMEFLAACKIFMEKWSQQYSTRVDFTFMPELFPGMRIELVGHSVGVYVQSVSHSFDFVSGSGFATSAVVTAPSAPPGTVTRIDGSRRQGYEEAHRVFPSKSGGTAGDGRNVR